ncbi:hypothetical protein ACWGDX_08910 [Streptomyces sp. NPDC055025]
MASDGGTHPDPDPDPDPGLAAGCRPRAGATSVAIGSRARIAASWPGTAGLNRVIRPVATGRTFSCPSATTISSGGP